MQFIVLGAGTAFSRTNYTSNFLLRIGTKNILFDCGVSCHAALAKQRLSAKDIDEVLISHLHADHVGGMEELAIKSYFDARRVRLTTTQTLAGDLWEKTMRGGLEYLEAQEGNHAMMTLADYFVINPIVAEQPFRPAPKAEVSVTFLPTEHILGMESYGFLIRSPRTTLFVSGDTKFNPEYIARYGTEADIILHDCSFRHSRGHSGVHSCYDQMISLPDQLKAKILLYHYDDGGQRAPDPPFLGLARAGDAFSLD